MSGPFRRLPTLRRPVCAVHTGALGDQYKGRTTGSTRASRQGGLNSVQARPATSGASMRATIIHAPGDIRVEDRDYPTVQLPTDAVVKVTASCVCGSDLWPYRGVKPTRTAHRDRPRIHRHRGEHRRRDHRPGGRRPGDRAVRGQLRGLPPVPQRCHRGLRAPGRLGRQGRHRARNRRRPGPGGPCPAGRFHPRQGSRHHRSRTTPSARAC